MPSTDEVRAFFVAGFPQCTAVVEEVREGWARLRQVVGEEHLRPGGTVSGPVMMATADAAAYAAILATVGIVPLAVTTSLNINFMRKPKAGCAIIADATLLKVGKRLAVAEIRITSEGDDALVAHATATYAIP